MWYPMRARIRKTKKRRTPSMRKPIQDKCGSEFWDRWSAKNSVLLAGMCTAVDMVPLQSAYPMRKKFGEQDKVREGMLG